MFRVHGWEESWQQTSSAVEGVTALEPSSASTPCGSLGETGQGEQLVAGSVNAVSGVGERLGHLLDDLPNCSCTLVASD
jgi:hypothetical protein